VKMDKNEFYLRLRKELENVTFLEDKPEETVDSTLKALWLAATGLFCPAEEAVLKELPELTAEQQSRLTDLIQKRVNNTPLAHITGRQKFMGIEFLADKRALIPRKETEILGRLSLNLSRQITGSKKTAIVIDVCCGSGNLGLSIARLNTKIKVYATDLSFEAVELTRDNIDFLDLKDRVEARQGDFLAAFESEEYYNNIDLIVCNPPYISTSKVEKMPAEIAINEPSLAFDGGMMGIKIIQKLIAESPRFLNENGWIVFEVGVGQGAFIMQLLERSGKYISLDSAGDPSGNIRAISAQKKPE
jgi:release factor glutamine methyltransferase